MSDMEALAREMLATFSKTSDGHRARVGQVQIARWEKQLEAACAAPDDVRALGTVECDHGAPLTVGVYRGRVNIAGRMLGQPAQEEFARLFVAACWEAGHHDGSQSREVPGE